VEETYDGRREAAAEDTSAETERDKQGDVLRLSYQDLQLSNVLLGHLYFHPRDLALGSGVWNMQMCHYADYVPCLGLRDDPPITRSQLRVHGTQRELWAQDRV
jgi:hypothetical protein